MVFGLQPGKGTPRSLIFIDSTGREWGAGLGSGPDLRARAAGENRRRDCPAGTFRFDSISKIAYTGQVKSSEFKRWLAAQGASFSPGKGSHLRVELKGKISYLPMHHKDLKKGLAEDI